MENKMSKEYEELVEVSMQILIHAGNSRNYFVKALDELYEENFEKAHENIRLATQEIREGHKIQTKTIQKESNGEELIYSMLFSHAQDTLMTAHSEVLIGEKLIKLFEKYAGDKNEK